MQTSTLRIVVAGAVLAAMSLGAFLTYAFWPTGGQLVGRRLGAVVCRDCEDVSILPPVFTEDTKVSCGLARSQGKTGIDPAKVAVNVVVNDEMLRLCTEDTRLMMMSTQKRVVAARSDNPKIAVASLLENNSQIVRVLGIGPGAANIIVQDEDGCNEIKVVQVLDADAENSRLLRTRFEKRREILVQLIRQVMPLAKVDVFVATGPGVYPTAEQLLANTVVVLTGTVAAAEDIPTVEDLANAVFSPCNAIACGSKSATIVNKTRTVPAQKVELKMTIASVNRTEAARIGMLKNYEALIRTGAVARTWPLDGPTCGFGPVQDSDEFIRILKDLRDRKVMRVLAEPHFLTLSGRPANYVDGGQIPVIAKSTGGSSVSYLQYGTVVNIVPIVLDNGKIHLEIAASISRPNAEMGVSIAAAGSLATAPGLTTCGAQLALQAENGRTLALAGLTHKAPVGNGCTDWLADLPLVGPFFSWLCRTENEFDLVILVTPSCQK